MNPPHDLLSRAVAALFDGAEGPGAAPADVLRGIRRVSGSLARVLVSAMGFPDGYAELTARQIAPKPVLYSAVVAARLGGDPPPASLAFLAPEFTCFLFDQTIDDYNAGDPAAAAPTAVRGEITRAAAVLTRQRPGWYHERLRELLERAPGPTPAHLAPYTLLAAGVRRRLAEGEPRNDVGELLTATADVLSREHLGMLAHAAAPDVLVRRPPDLPELALDPGASDVELPAAEAAGLARVESPGLVMVAVNQYLHARRDGDRPVSALLAGHPALVPALRTLAAVVSLWDDLGDLDADRRTDSPNVLLGPPAMRRGFVEAGRLPSGGPVAAAVLDGRAEPELAGEAAALADSVLAGLAGPGAPGDLRLFVRVLETVVHGAFVNAEFNDDLAARMAG